MRRSFWVSSSGADDMVPGYQLKEPRSSRWRQRDTCSVSSTTTPASYRTPVRDGRAARSRDELQLRTGRPPAIFDAAHNPRGATGAGGGPSRPPGQRRRLLPGHPRGEGRDRDRRPAGTRLLPLRLHGDPARAHRGLRAARRAVAAGAGVRRPLRAGRGARPRRFPIRSRPGSGHESLPGSREWGRAGGRQPLPSVADMDREARSELLTMMGLVAIVVAVVILVFFAFGYVFGLLFL